jgi:hypothetical protein
MTTRALSRAREEDEADPPGLPDRRLFSQCCQLSRAKPDDAPPPAGARGMPVAGVFPEPRGPSPPAKTFRNGPYPLCVCAGWGSRGGRGPERAVGARGAAPTSEVNPCPGPQQGSVPLPNGSRSHSSLPGPSGDDLPGAGPSVRGSQRILLLRRGSPFGRPAPPVRRVPDYRIFSEHEEGGTPELARRPAGQRNRGDSDLPRSPSNRRSRLRHVGAHQSRSTHGRRGPASATIRGSTLGRDRLRGISQVNKVP